jgi:hypothetical protein
MEKGEGKDAMQLVKERLIVAGHVMTHICYERPLIYGLSSNNRAGRSVKADDDRSTVIRSGTLRKAKVTIRNLINSNVGRFEDEDHRKFIPKFLTLTFAENETDLNRANKEFRNFIRRLSYKLGNDIKYIGGIEFQDRGAIHYHIVLFNCPFIPVKDFYRIWGLGDVTIKALNDVDNLGVYVTKRFEEYLDDERLMGHKCYLRSKGLYEPEILTDEREIARRLRGRKPVYVNSIINEARGRVDIEQYNDKRIGHKIKFGAGCDAATISKFLSGPDGLPEPFMLMPQDAQAFLQEQACLLAVGECQGYEKPFEQYN